MTKKTPPTQNKRLATVDDFRKAAEAGGAVRGQFFREATFGTIDVEARTVELAFSSETPVDRGYLIEILDHGKDSVDMSWIASGRAPLCADHDLTIHIGVIKSAELGKDRVGRAVARFGRGAQADAYFQDVIDGIRTCISFGYSIEHVILEEETDKGAIYRVMKWKPLEISLVSLPADQTVGIGRSEGDEGEENNPIQPIIKKETRTMSNPENNGAANPNPAPAPAPVDANQVRTEARNTEVARIREIQALGTRHKLDDKANEFIGQGKTADEFRSFVLDSIGAPKPVATGADHGSIGLSDKEARQFSIVKLLNSCFDPHDQRAREAASFEREVCAATAKNARGRTFRGNVQIPTEVLVAARGMDAKRALNVANGAQGGYTVDTDLRADSFIEVLRNKLLVKQLGATVLSGLEGDVAIPKQTGGATAYWITEGTDTTASQQTFGQVALRPKTVSAQTKLTRKLLLQSSLDIEALVRDDLAFRLAAAIDRAALKGSGSGAEPLGILNTTGIGSVSITTHTFTFAKMVDLESELSVDNADLGKLAYLASAADRGRMKQTEKASSTGIYIWGDGSAPGVGMVNGYTAYATNQLADDEVIFGNWGDLLIGEWGVLDLLVNPFTDDASGGVRITAFQDVDVAVRHAESFARTQA